MASKSSPKQNDLQQQQQSATPKSPLDQVIFVTARPILQRLDVWPFLSLYVLLFSYYYNFSHAIEEWAQICVMIAILLVVIAHVSLLLAGYWHVTLRVKLAYNVHTNNEILSTFSKFEKTRFHDGIRAAQDDYESALTRYKLWYQFYEKKLMAAKMQHGKAVQMYRNNPDNAIPPGPFEPPTPPLEPQLGLPVVLYHNAPLEVCVIPHKHHGNPILTPVHFGVSDGTMIQFKIEGLLTPEEVLGGSFINNSSRIIFSGPLKYPPLQFSYHLAQYTLDPSIETTFQSLQFPDNLPLVQYLTHSLTTTIPTPISSQLNTITNKSKTITNKSQQQSQSTILKPLYTARNTISLSQLAEQATSALSSGYRSLYYGFNSLSVPIPGFITLFIDNAMSPFFIFQIVCILLWCLDEYWYYSLFTLFMIVALECTVVYKRQSHLNQMLGDRPSLPFVHVYRRFESLLPNNLPHSNNNNNYNKTQIENEGGWILTPTKLLVPGDIVALPVYTDSTQINSVFGAPITAESTDNDDDDNNNNNNSTNNNNNNTQVDMNSLDFNDRSQRPTLFTTDVPCDMLLLSGSCICDEAILTGESLPQLKEDLISLQTSKDDEMTDIVQINELDQIFDEKQHKRHLLFSGTKLIGVQRNYQHALFTPSFLSNDKAITTTTTTTTTKSSQKNNNKNKSIDDIDDDINNDIDYEYAETDPLSPSSTLSKSNQQFLTLSSRPPLPPRTDVILCRVLKTGFSTSQGSLVRTILTAADNVLIDREALYFILGLLCCAIISAYFVLIEGLADTTRSRYKLLLNVITILTSVVPPELPMQLSMAVNNALASLAKTQVFCTEPNRLPSSGEIDICCFDKTGTLTADTFFLTCAVTPGQGLIHNNDNNNNQGNTKDTNDNDYIIMRIGDNNNDDSSDSDNDSDDDNDKEVEPNLDLRSLPIDTRLVLGCAQELAMLQLPPKKINNDNDTNKKQKPNQRIVGDPMEAVGFQRAGFHFHPKAKLNEQQQSSSSDTDNTSHRVFFDATPVNYDSNNIKYNPTPSSTKIRIDAESIHTFSFQSQLQRMSAIISVSPPNNQFPTLSSSKTNDNNNNTYWFNSSLPQHLQLHANKTLLRVVTKGSPEMIYHSLHPDYRPSFEEYTRQHKELARQGLRVLALAWKPLFVDPTTQMLCNIPDELDHDKSRHHQNAKGSIDGYQDWVKKHPKGTFNQYLSILKIPSREQCETGLFFAGIIGFNSPLKTQTAEVIQHLHDSNHKTIMVTGDHLLTAIAVAKSLHMAKTNCLLLSVEDENADNTISQSNETNNNHNTSTTTTIQQRAPKLVWKDEYEVYQYDFDPINIIPNLTTLIQTTSLCIGGNALNIVMEYYSSCLPLLCTYTSVFARTLPIQKELILKNIREFKRIGTNQSQKTIFCGDGTNDVGALTHSDIGIALSSIDTDSKEQLTAQDEKRQKMNKNPIIKRYLDGAQKLREKGFIAQAETMEKNANDMFKRLQQSQFGSILNDMDEDDDGTVKLGDASLAASFSAKHGSIRCVLDVIRQGRCALATTGQMYQILALQCLVAAYSLSALYFKGVRQSESQMTISGMASAIMSMLLSNAQPLQKVSAKRPNSKIFSPYNIATIGLQFIVHLSILMYMVNYAMEFTDIETLKQGQDETITKYIPSVLNTVVFVLSTAMSATTILSNYVGFPFMTPLTWTPLFKLILGTLGVCCALSMEMMPELNETLEMTPMPNEDFSFALTTSILVDCVLCVIIGVGTKLIFGIVSWSDLTKPIPKDVISHAISNTKATTTTSTTTTTGTKSTTGTNTNHKQLTSKKKKTN